MNFIIPLWPTGTITPKKKRTRDGTDWRQGTEQTERHSVTYKTSLQTPKTVGSSPSFSYFTAKQVEFATQPAAPWGQRWPYNRTDQNCAGSRMIRTSRLRWWSFACFCSVSTGFTDQCLSKLRSNRSSEYVEIPQCCINAHKLWVWNVVMFVTQDMIEKIMGMKCSHVRHSRHDRENTYVLLSRWKPVTQFLRIHWLINDVYRIPVTLMVLIMTTFLYRSRVI